MTQNEIIEMASKCLLIDKNTRYGIYVDALIDFANLVAQHEREECKKLCTWKTGNKFVDEAVAVCYRAIDLRWQA